MDTHPRLPELSNNKENLKWSWMHIHLITFGGLTSGNTSDSESERRQWLKVKIGTYMQMHKVQFIRGFARMLLLFAVSYGLLYFSYKFYIPWGGGDDFAHYYAMYLKPLDFSVAPAPFVYRQLSAILTNAVYSARIYYPNEIWFQYPGYDQRIFFAAIFSNYLCLIAAAWLSGVSVETLTRARSLVYPMIAGLLCFLSFYNQIYVLTGLTEGVSWLLIAAGFLAYLQRRKLIVGAVLFLAVFQRETIIIAFIVIAACMFVLNPQQRRYNGGLLLWAMICLIIYIAMRNISGIGGHEDQIDPQNILMTLASFRVTRDMLFQGLLSQNMLAIYVCLSLLTFRLIPEQRIWMPTLIATFVVLFVSGLAVGIGNNVGRICGILTPIFASFVSIALLHLDERVSVPWQTKRSLLE